MMSLHKLTAGSGYDYLTRQVAAQDSTTKGHTSLADYYEQKGESPGRWLGSGLVGIEGLEAGDQVTADQMLSLFGIGDHPLARGRLDALDNHATARDVKNAMRLGQRWGIYSGGEAFADEVSRRIAAWNRANGHPDGAPVTQVVRASIRTAVGLDRFQERFGRAPLNPRELTGFIARDSRPSRQGVAGYDVTFSPVKSVSALWALVDPQTAARIQHCHDLAVADALRYIEQESLYTRRGRNGVRQVKTHGLVAAAFTHRDSRAGDPDLHTHVAVANKVQAVDDGDWLAIDGRLLYLANVAASERYNTALEQHLTRDLGVRFVDRQDGRDVRPVREIAGVDPALLRRWSQRDLEIRTAQGELVGDFQREQGRTPTPGEQHALGQRATLETREAKHEPRSLAEQRRAWAAQAEAVLGRGGVARMVAAALNPGRAERRPVDEAWLDATAARVVRVVERNRATWQVWHVRAEVERQVRRSGRIVSEAAAQCLVDLALTRHSIPLDTARDMPGDVPEPMPLRRADGTSMYVVAGSARYSSAPILAAERLLLATAGRRDGMVVGQRSIDLALLEAHANGVRLNDGQVELVRAMASSGSRLQVAIAPAGAGKTTAMNALASAWREAGGDVIGLAPSAAAADALGQQLGGHADTMHKLTRGLDDERLPGWAAGIGPRTLVVIDEAGMADTLTLEQVVSFVVSRGGSVRLVGDDHQLSAVEAGGVLCEIATEHGAVRLDEVVRFSDPAEATASLGLRQGRPTALGFYLDRQRVHVGDATTTLDQAFAGWVADRARGLDSLMLAPTHDLVAQLNARARAQRLGGRLPGREASLADGNRVSAGDTIVTRRNERRLTYSRHGWVRNGDRWTVLAVGRDQSLTVANASGWQVRLPAGYVRDDVVLGYASTIHGAQGLTVDSMHGVLSGQESRQQLYTMMTRGRHANHVYVTAVGDGDPHSLLRPEVVRPPTPTELLEAVLSRDDAALSAVGSLREQSDPALLLKPAVDRYVDAVGVAAEQVVGADRMAEIERSADSMVLWLTEAAAWPALRTHLLTIEASGGDSIQALRRGIDSGGLDDAQDPAAVLSWRLQPIARGGPLPWLDGVPESLRADPVWGVYVEARQQLVRELADEVRNGCAERRPAWLADMPLPPSPALAAEITVWRCAMGVSDGDLRPTGAAQPAAAAARWQYRLDQALVDEHPEVRQWTNWLRDTVPDLQRDPHTAVVGRQVAAWAADGDPVRRWVRDAVADGLLPDDHPAAALASRIERQRTAPPIWETVEPINLHRRPEDIAPPMSRPPSHGPRI
ncbi:MobF family relaxase [Micropruina sonneratiae]|uniref:MobF family relaxase n=1 Tax=Micropruina sonneratiae TaxID=2986940 RepID=UPI002226D2F4|nr:MobF family relaxase [Micropruina sp. KQZ13P-5]MCW3158000.1 relaxase domain-containing protein [Micropruina sp. KQZ13P-5]MCW3158578.1 relaxase domain-containing protein [Micropruina sp. KQZ13P-5]